MRDPSVRPERIIKGTIKKDGCPEGKRRIGEVIVWSGGGGRGSRRSTNKCLGEDPERDVVEIVKGEVGMARQRCETERGEIIQSET